MDSASAGRRIIDRPDVILIGGGILSASLGVMLKRLEPRLRIQLFEAGEDVGRESSEGWNNAGTGHAGLCEISYTPFRGPDGGVDVTRALAVFEQFEHSMQFWGHAVATGMAGDPAGFIRAVPHVAFVEGGDDVAFLGARHAAMARHHFFERVEHTADAGVIAAWAPLVMEGRGRGPVAATMAQDGTEVDFGELARRLIGWLGAQEDCGIATRQRVTGLSPDGGKWEVAVECGVSGEGRRHGAGFVFVGAGGGCLPLLRSTGLAEVRGLGGFPIGGQWLVCDDPGVTARHWTKVYGTTPPSAPSLGGPHLDLRRLRGAPRLMFGPFASWTTRFLKQAGSWTDLPRSIGMDNLGTLVRSALRNRDLVKFLVTQGWQSMEDRMAALRAFYPRADAADWRLVQAGIRVQALRREDRGAVHFGTDVFAAAGGTLAAVLGASPGASVSASVALEVILACRPGLLACAAGRERMRAMIPTFGTDLRQAQQAALFRSVHARIAETLRLRAGEAGGGDAKWR